MYYRGSLGGLLIFDLTFYESFEHLPQWIEEIRANVKSDIPILLVGNKSDLIDTRAVTYEEINEFTKNFNLYYMETSAKTGEGVGDCFYILACLMVGAGVPDQLVSNAIVFNPGEILITTKVPSVKVPEPTIKVESETVPKIEPEPEIEFAAPPVPEPSPKIESKTISKIEPEPEIEFAAPPVPEPSPIIDSKSKITPLVDKSLEFEFKSPEEILSNEIKEPEFEIPEVEPPKVKPIETKTPEIKQPEEIFEKKPQLSVSPSISETVSTPSYKPKSVPFVSNIPEPATPPEEFQPAKIESDSLVDYMPETIIDKKEIKRLEKQKKKEEKEKKLEEKRKKAAETKEAMQKVGKDKEAEKEAEKERIKEERLKIKEEKEKKLEEKKKKAAETKEAMQKVGKEKEEEKEKIKKAKEKKKKKEEEEIIPTTEIHSEVKIPEQSEASSSSLFETLYQKKSTNSTPSAFLPFSQDEKMAANENPFLKFIPNVADINNEQSKDMEHKVQSTFQTQPQSGKKKEIIICNQCGSILSSDYAFCNKCGSKL